MVAGCRLRDDVDRAGGHGRERVGAAGSVDEGRVHDDRRRMTRHDPLDRLDAVHDRQIEVHQHDRGAQPVDERNGFAAVARLPDHAEGSVGVDRSAEETPLHRGVVDDEDVDRACRCGVRTVHAVSATESRLVSCQSVYAARILAAASTTRSATAAGTSP